MRTSIPNWFEAPKGMETTRVSTVTPILSIIAIAGAVTAGITAFANTQLGSVG